MKNIEAGAGRWLDVSPPRFPGWIASFAERHGAAAPDAVLTVTLAGENVIYTAPDGAVAECHPPFPPVPFGPAAAPGADPAVPGADPALCAEAIAAHAMATRTVGVLLVRLGGYAAGVFTGSPPELAESKTGARPVHGRSAAGGWSQHRFARRREKQAAEALQAAAAAAVAVFERAATDNSKKRQRDGERAAPPVGRPPRTAPPLGPSPLGPSPLGPSSRDNSKRRPRGMDAVGLDAVVLGGDKRAMAELRADPRLAPYLAVAVDRFLTVPDPKLAVLKDTPRLFLAVRIRLTEPAL